MTSSSPLPEPSSDQRYLQRLATLELEDRKCRKDPRYFIRKYCITEDELDPANPFKHFPDEYWPCLEHLIDRLQTENLLAVEKSRQMMVTWLVAAFFLWEAMYRPSSREFIQSKKQEDANANLARIADSVQPETGGMYGRLPTWMKQKHPVKITSDRVRFLGSVHSEIRAIPQGAEVAAGYTISRLWSDEFAKQDECEDTWRAIRPTLGAGKGKVVFTSSAKGGTWAHKLVEDRLEPGTPPPPLFHHQLCEGLTIRRLARNRFTVLRLHYTADPAKRDPDWIRDTRAGMSEADWQQEYEINWTAYSGVPALPQFMLWRDKILCTPFEIPHWWPRYISADYGVRNPYSWHLIAIGPDGTAYVYDEYYRPGPLEEAVGAMRAHPDFPKVIEVILDASCWAGTQQAGHQVRSIADLHEDLGVYPTRAQVVQDRVKIAAWEKAWANLDQNEPTLKIFRTCAAAIRELPSIRWQDLSERVQQDRNLSEKLVDRDNHAFDDLSYFLLHRAVTGGEEPERDLPPAELARQDSAHFRAKDREKAVEERDKQEQQGWVHGWDD